ncbi:MAG: ABC transporter permease subunit, partial [Candidatus Korarchaeota archaeon]|nr:ABC transporter permease subunit [Candidatus Korarchaeota archaeon]
TLLGTLAGYAGGVIDEALLRVTDIFFAFPALILALVFTAILPVGERFLFFRLDRMVILRLAIILVWWPPYVRLMRGQILSEKEKSYVEALRALGAGYPKTFLVIQERFGIVFSKIVALGEGRLRFLLIFQRVINGILDQLVLFGMHLRILFRHILPNSIYPILVQGTLDFGGVVLTFSALMFLGFS